MCFSNSVLKKRRLRLSRSWELFKQRLLMCSLEQSDPSRRALKKKTNPRSPDRYHSWILTWARSCANCPACLIPFRPDKNLRDEDNPHFTDATTEPQSDHSGHIAKEIVGFRSEPRCGWLWSPVTALWYHTVSFNSYSVFTLKTFIWYSNYLPSVSHVPFWSLFDMFSAKQNLYGSTQINRQPLPTRFFFFNPPISMW